MYKRPGPERAESVGCVYKNTTVCQGRVQRVDFPFLDKVARASNKFIDLLLKKKVKKKNNYNT